MIEEFLVYKLLIQDCKKTNRQKKQVMKIIQKRSLPLIIFISDNIHYMRFGRRKISIIKYSLLLCDDSKNDISVSYKKNECESFSFCLLKINPSNLGRCRTLPANVPQ